MSSKLHQVKPREQVGAQTGAAYEFQYHQAAAGALEVLDEGKVACVYCEWHDDFVVEVAGIASYRFHQVKTRAPSQGPWTLKAFFGIKRSKGPKPKTGHPPPLATGDSVFGRLYDHVLKFGDRCEHFVFVTDAGIDLSFEQLLTGVRGAQRMSDLTGKVAQDFQLLVGALPSAFTSITADQIFAFLTSFYVQPAMGKLGDLRACRTLIGGRIHELSEVDLTMSQAQKIGSDLVAMVRDKSHRVLPTLPSNLGQLQASKGLVLADVLGVLSLSNDGYRALKTTGKEGIIALSRLHRLCRRSGIREELIPELCRLKANWDVWWVKERHMLQQLDVISMKQACADALALHHQGSMTFDQLRRESENICAKFSNILTSNEKLSRELVFGLLLSVAVEAQA